MHLRSVLCLILLSLPTAAIADRLDFTDSQFDLPPASSRPLTLVFTGDTKLCGRTAQQMQNYGTGYPFARVADVLRGADLCFGNCETAITEYPQHTPGKSASAVKAGKAFVFKSDPRVAGPVLADAGFDIVQLANNHAMDWCAEGLLDTMRYLDDAGIAHVGAGANYGAACAPRIVAVDALRIGFLGYSLILPPQSAARNTSPGVNYLPPDYKPLLRHHIEQLRGHADLVIVGYHWGKEGSTVPDTRQREIARATIDAGAHAVIGTHTHSFQGIEHYRGGVIAYSLGNFVFTGKSRLLAGGILRLTIERSGESRISDVALLPCWIKDGVPTPANDARLLGKLSAPLKATGSKLGATKDGWLSVTPIP